MSRARFFIDECLSVEQAGLAWQRGYQASHLRDLDLLGRKDGELAPVIFEGDWSFVTKNARDFRGPDNAKGRSGEYAGVDLHANLVCIHGPPEGFTKAEQLEAFAVAFDLIERHVTDTTRESTGSVRPLFAREVTPLYSRVTQRFRCPGQFARGSLVGSDFPIVSL